jgi:hypothetical protein
MESKNDANQGGPQQVVFYRIISVREACAAVQQQYRHSIHTMVNKWINPST